MDLCSNLLLASTYGIELEKSQKSLEGSIKYFAVIIRSPKSSKFDLITAFHVVEHLQDPIEIVAMLGSLLTDDGHLVVEVPSADDALLTLYSCDAFQNFTYWSQHLYSYR